MLEKDIDVAANKGKGKDVASNPEGIKVNNKESLASLAKIIFIMKLLTENLLMYGSFVHVLLPKDAEISYITPPSHKGLADMYYGEIFHHILHKFLPYSWNSKKEKKTEVDWKHKLASKASQFIVAACVHSTEARKRVFFEVDRVFRDFVDSSEGFRPPENNVQAFVNLFNDVLVALQNISTEASLQKKVFSQIFKSSVTVLSIPYSRSERLSFSSTPSTPDGNSSGFNTDDHPDASSPIKLVL
ncbi:hypothetical protein AgCh_004787 [Apium graveolens]